MGKSWKKTMKEQYMVNALKKLHSKAETLNLKMFGLFVVLRPAR